MDENMKVWARIAVYLVLGAQIVKELGRHRVVNLVRAESWVLSMNGNMYLALGHLRQARMIDCVAEVGVAEVGMVKRYNLCIVGDSGTLRSRMELCMYREDGPGS